MNSLKPLLREVEDRSAHARSAFRVEIQSLSSHGGDNDTNIFVCFGDIPITFVPSVSYTFIELGYYNLSYTCKCFMLTRIAIETLTYRIYIYIFNVIFNSMAVKW